MHANFFSISDAIEVDETVDGNVYIAAGKITISGTVNGDVLLCGGSIDVPGRVSGNVLIFSGEAVISGHIGGSVKAYTGDLQVTSSALIHGDLQYGSSHIATISPYAEIIGQVRYRPAQLHDKMSEMLSRTKIATFLMNVLYTLAVGLILIRFFPDTLKNGLTVLKNRPLKALGYGILLLFLIPLISLLLLITILGIPFALTLIAALFVGFYTAKVYSILWISTLVFPKQTLRIAFLIGLIAYFCLTSLPFIGTPISLAAMLFGFGASAIPQIRFR